MLAYKRNIRDIKFDKVLAAIDFYFHIPYQMVVASLPVRCKEVTPEILSLSV